MMTDKTRIHPKIFVSTPREHVNIPPEKLYQLFLLLKRQSNLAPWNNNVPVEAYQRRIISCLVLKFQAQSIMQIKIHNLCLTALIHHHPLNIIDLYLESDHQGIIMWLYDSNIVLFRETHRWLVLYSSPLRLRSRVLSRWPGHRHHLKGVRNSSPRGHEDEIDSAQRGSRKSTPLKS